jgi:hypothetical protein
MQHLQSDRTNLHRHRPAQYGFFVAPIPLGSW